MATNDPNVELFQQIASYLNDMGLGGLFNVGSDGTPGGWLWDQIVSGIDSEQALNIALEQTSEFKSRYGIISELRDQASKGQAVHVPTVAEVRQYEQQAAALFRNAGLPSWMYDSWQDGQELMRKGMSIAEVEQRLGSAWERVQNADPAVREAFTQFYGYEGDAALAAAFLDPTRTVASLERASRAAYTAGMGKSYGLSIDQQTAERIADQPKTESGIAQDLQQTAQIIGSGLTSATISESPTDLTNQDVLNAVAFGDGKSASTMERRQIERKAQQSAVPGGALRTNRGLTGVG